MITKKQLITGTLNFIPKYKRLPYYFDDDIEVKKRDKNNKLILSPFRTNKYIKKYFGTQNKYTKYLLDNKKITYDIISEIIKIEENRLKKLLNRKIKNPTAKDRRQIEIFFNKDYFPKLDKYNDMCSKCKEKCKQPYWADILDYRKYKKN